MNINQITTNNTAFKMKNSQYVYRILRNSKKNTHVTNAGIKSAIPLALVVSPAELMRNQEALKAIGFTYCEVRDDTIDCAAGYNGGYYSVGVPYKANPELFKIGFIKQLLTGNRSLFGGLLNYKDMINDLKRQDIVKKGLMLHTYKLNSDIPEEQKEEAAISISNLSKKDVNPEDLFFFDSEAFYYDKLDKTAYSVDALTKYYGDNNPTFRVCKFDTNKFGNVIGYTTTAMNIFRLEPTDTLYKEQQEPSEPLPPIADMKNNKLFAEAFRFGNSTSFGIRYEDSVKTVLKHLSDIIGQTYLQTEDLQFVKIYDKNKNIIKRICYFDSSTGRSIVYNEEGKYLYQMVYNKDSLGNINACAKY